MPQCCRAVSQVGGRVPGTEQFRLSDDGGQAGARGEEQKEGKRQAPGPFVSVALSAMSRSCLSVEKPKLLATQQ